VTFDKKEVLEALKLEIEFMERGGYNPSVRDPHRQPRTFRDSVTCLNLGLDEKKAPCTNCFLIEFVPPHLREGDGDLCHKIPLNYRGDTVESLEGQGDSDKVVAAVLGWLKRTVAELEAGTTAEAPTSAASF
jgi:hypothetical protein